MSHLGITHEDEDERITTPTVPNILSQSLSDIPIGGGGGQFTGGGISGTFGRPQGSEFRMGGRTGPQPGGVVDILEAEFRKPVPSRGIINPRLALLPERPVITPETTAELVAGAEVFTPEISVQPSVTRGITPRVATTPTAPVLGDIDFTSIKSLLKGFGTVSRFVQDLGRFNRARGIVPGGRGKKGRDIKISDIQNRIEFLEEQRIEGLITEEQKEEITDELSILNQFVRSRLGVKATRAARGKEEKQRREDIQAILAR